MKRPLFLSLLACLGPLLAVDIYAATLTGVVDLTSKSRRRRGAQSYATPNSEKADPTPPQLAVLYLTSPSINLDEHPPKPAELKQEGLQFLPSVLVVQTGSEVFFPNMDDTFHNVFSYSPAKSFDLGRYKSGENPPSRTFEQAGVVQVFCEVHDHMRATILVVDSPYFETTNSKGEFTLTDVPPGTYTLHAWINPRTQAQKDITIEDGVDLTLSVSSNPASITIVETQLQN